MVGYRKLSGDYLEVQDGTPVSPTMTPVALRPSPLHVFAAGWNTAPMDAAICWRLKTAPELAADRDAELTAFLDSPGGKAMKSMLLVGVDKGLWTVAELRAKYRSL